MGKEPPEPGLWDAAPCPEEHPGVLIPGEHFGGFRWKIASEGRCLSCSPMCYLPALEKSRLPG